MKKKKSFSIFLEIQKKHFFIPNIEQKGVGYDCTQVLSVPLLYKEVVEKICLGHVFKKNYIMLVIHIFIIYLL